MSLGKIYGIGVGPGDPELLTVKAAGLIKSLPVLCAPRASDDSESFALSIVKGCVDTSRQKVITAIFPMSMDKAVLEKAWDEAAESITAELLAGNDVGFLTLGDPSLYSTYAYILAKVRARLPEVASETVPGVSSISLAAARAGVDLALGSERLAVMPIGRDMDALGAAMDGFDTVVLMKVNRGFPKLVELLDKKGLLSGAVYVSRCGTDRERIIRDLKYITQAELDYLSLVIVRRQ
ncbi:MAG: precorrin-2 C(20)-methyltransferase [Nitrospirae bacterium]|nr:precorrin-2 C(20)-methyltransferase [Nitrospirota bacterium]